VRLGPRVGYVLVSNLVKGRPESFADVAAIGASVEPGMDTPQWELHRYEESPTFGVLSWRLRKERDV
jgi:hypothetical protein